MFFVAPKHDSYRTSSMQLCFLRYKQRLDYLLRSEGTFTVLLRIAAHFATH